MGICDSPKREQNISGMEDKNSVNSEINQNLDDENSNNIDTHHSSNSQIDNKEKESSIPEIKNNKPDLAKYERSAFQSGKRSEYSNFTKTQSLFSTLTEEEVIIKGEINKNCQNKEEDFDNNSFKDLVKKNGGIIIKKGDKKNSICSNKEVNHFLKYGKENISEIKSKHTFPFRTINGNTYKNNLRASGSSLELIQNTFSENNYNKNKNNDPLYQNLSSSTKIDVSMQECNQFLNIPKIDEPLPDLDELSNGNPFTLGRDSLISDSN